MAAAHVSELVTELQTEYERSRAFLSALEQSLKKSRVDEDNREATADGSELDAADAEAPATNGTVTCDAPAPPKKSGSLKGKLARFFSRKESKSSSSSKMVVVDPTAENDANVSSVQGLRRASVVALGDHLDDSCVASGGHSQLAKRSQSFVTRSGNSLAAMPAPQLSSAAMLRATSFRATPVASASQFQLDNIVPPYPAAAASVTAASASQLSLPAVEFRRGSFSMARGGGAAGGLPAGLGHTSSGCRRRSVEVMLGQQAPSPSGGSFSGGGRRASVETAYVASGAAASVSVTSGTGAAGGCSSTSGASLFKKLQQLHVPVSECGLPELSPCSPRATLAGGTLFGPGGSGAAGSPTSQRAQSMQHSPSFQRRSVASSAQHTFVDGAAQSGFGALQHPTASIDGGADMLTLAQAGAGSLSGASARRSSLHMPPSAAPSLAALRSQSFRHGGGGSRASTGTGCGACAVTAAAITNEHADLAPEDEEDEEDGVLCGGESATPARRVASMGPIAGGAATSLMTSLLRRADVVMAAAAASPTGGSGGASPRIVSGHGMLAGAVDAVDVAAAGVGEAGAPLGPGAAGAAGSRTASGTAAFVPGGALYGSQSSRRLTTTQLMPPLASPVGHRAPGPGLLQSAHSFGHALWPTPPPAGPLAPQPPHGGVLLGAAAAAADGSQSPAASAAASSPSYLSQHRRMSFRAGSSTTVGGVGSPSAGHSGGAAFVI
ncbi:hypothetical protein HXX76_002409 [Chlamydomonas incerta]|uniref:Uncharacterized protein n=1 Tax=Chlamydomonas incerta TaxID=51695 RepID=A0A835TF89_CHLIN|nr:hypothetical protein HXX76_002409 [Chlamydomonas incerta]|eukprot:KAG2442323.1 hypothetical protein HXX76_002409 [Chlamydomonas incerta]